jgi:chromosome segregation ATPase
MDLTPLLTAPVIGVSVALVILSAWVGYATGKSNENKRKTEALEKARLDAKNALLGLQETHSKKIETLSNANLQELEKEKDSYASQVKQLHQAHQNVVDSLKNSHTIELENLRKEHNGLLGKIENSNKETIDHLKAEHEQRTVELKTELHESISRMRHEQENQRNSLKEQHQKDMQLLRQDHEQTIAALKQQTEQTVTQVRQDNERRIQEQSERHKAEIERLGNQIAEHRQEREKLHTTISDQEATIINLQNEIREAKLNNMFSVSKSGEKLIRVVRSVQELASELDETSRTVTDGEYSFFEQIKDQRDRDVVLSLTGGMPEEEPVAETTQEKPGTGSAEEISVKETE